eukprot:TRINITY_DN1013_c0_g1_i1.p1 TRINITY_DN1013_c0_g1~~TRINITY_DN1013_c0_g1_i1.p1  ORF type:complete len:379 (-),score=52.55 TRINITY_DN1013_c0_g1_i1:22-1059(-)
MEASRLLSLATQRRLVPSLEVLSESHKGQCGRVGVLGGCLEYTGAPYLSAVSSLRCGSDLAWVFCSKEAAVPIKSYGPEVITLPYLRTTLEATDTPPESRSSLVATVVRNMKGWLSRLHVLVVGPGLGRDELVQHTAVEIIRMAREMGLPMVIDADGLQLLYSHPELIRGYSKAILTPNQHEYSALCQSFPPFPSASASTTSSSPATSASTNNTSKTDRERILALSRTLGNVTIVKKGASDLISDGTSVLECSTQGARRRCGGQGDVLAGILGTFNAWAHLYPPDSDANSNSTISSPVLAAWSGCHITRAAAHRAYDEHHRSMLAADIVPHIGPTMEEYFPLENE